MLVYKVKKHSVSIEINKKKTKKNDLSSGPFDNENGEIYIQK